MNKPLKYLEEIKKVLLELPEDSLHMEDYAKQTPCGTVFCIFGHCVDKSPFFKEESWDWNPHKNHPCHNDDLLNGPLVKNVIGINACELWALCNCESHSRREYAKKEGLSTDLKHFNTETPTTKDAIEVVDILIQRYKKKDDNNAN